MSHIIADRVKEKIQSPASTGILSLLNTTSGYRRFSSVMSSGDTCYYCLECPSNGDWECGLGTYSSNNALSRTTVYSSSNGGAVVNFANRVSYVFISYVASRAIYLDPSGELNLALNTLNDVSLTAPASGESLKYNGSSWVNGVVAGYTTEEAQDAVGGILTDTSSISFSYNDGAPSISASVRGSGITDVMISGGVDALKIGSGSVSSTEFGYLDGVTSSLQVQLDSKYGSANPSGYLTASVASATYQPLDSDLTSIASTGVDSYGIGLLTKTSGSGVRDYIGVGTSSFDGAYASLSGVPSTFAPSAHTHGNITNAGAIGSTTGLPIVTTASGVLTAGSFGTTAGTFAAGDDSRITGALSTSTAAATYAVIAAGQPISGTVGQVLTKNSGTNYDSSWTSLVLGDRYLSTSTTSNAVSNGTKTFTIGTGLAYTPTQNITIAYDATHHMHGEVTTYNSGTGVLVVDINNHTGTGTYTSWVVNVGGVTPVTVVSWGDIIGTLGTQSDLSTALNAKLEITTAASTYLPLAGGTLTGPITGTSNTVQFRSSTTAQLVEVFNTYTSATSLEAFRIKANAASAYQIGSAIGSAGGTTRGVGIGSWDSAGTFSSVLQVNPAISGVSNPTVSVATNGAFSWASKVLMGPYDGGSVFYWYAYSGLTSYVFQNNDPYPSSIVGYTSLKIDATSACKHAFNLPAGTTSPASLYVGTNSASHLVFAVRGFSGQTANLTEWQNSSGTVLASIGNKGAVLISPEISTSGSPTAFTLTGAAHTTLTLSTEATDVNFNLSRTVQFATGALTTQRAMRIQAPTYSFVGASTITTASTLSISGPPVAGTNATITNAYALNVESGNARFGGSLVIGGLTIANGSGSSGACSITAATFTSTEPYLIGYPWHFAANDVVPKVTIDAANSLGIKLASNMYLGFGATTNSRTGTADTLLYRDGAGILAQRNSTNAQTLRVYNTYTSSTSYECINIKGKASANFEIGPENGSAGGTLRGLTLGGYTAGSATITPWLTFTNAGAATFAGAITASNLSGTNTGDQDLSSYATTSAVAAGYVALTGTQTVAGVKTFTSSLTYSADGAALSQTYKCYNPSTANGTQFLCQRARGSAATPLYPASGDVLLGLYGYGWDQNLAGFSLQAHYICSASAAWTTTPISQGTQWTWGTTDPLDIATVNTNRMRLHGDGSLTLGSIASTGGLFQLVGTNTAATGLGTATNRLRFTDIDTSVLADQPIGEIEFYSGDGSPTASGVRACFGAYTESTALATAFVWGLGAANATPSEVMRLTSTGRLGLGTAGVAVSAFLHVISTSLQMRVGYDVSNYYTTTVSSGGAITFEAVGASAGFTFSDPVTLSSTSTATGLLTATVGIKTTKTIYQTTETTSTPAAGAVTIDLTLNNHQTLSLTSLAAAGTSQVTFTPPTGSSAGTLIVKQHATASKDITTWAVTGGTIKWMGTEPNWVGDAATNLRVVSWRWDGSIMYLAATDVGT